MTSRSHLPVAMPTVVPMLAVGAGSMAAPGLAIAGDADSGLFSPAADTLALGVGGAEGVRVSPNRNVSIGTTVSTSARLHVASTGQPLRCDHSGDTASIFYGLAGSPTFAGNAFTIDVTRSASSAYSFLYARSGVGSTTDVEFNLSGNGSGYCDGSWTGGGADYAEFFEWADGNPTAEDRRGLSVVLEGTRVRPATNTDPAASIVGVVSARPSVVGDAAWNAWSGKYLRDAFGAYVVEEVDLFVWTEDGVTRSCSVEAVPDDTKVPAGALRRTERRRKLNESWDPAKPYVPREHRPEWAPVGLVGKLCLRRGQPTGDRWIRLRDCGPEVEEWLVR
ncbi:peptidase G2 autoproteolytic cleavage domain-containing protein [Azospirillum isscasi]|uniref:Peptidase G2 autoproteolytic cleavage domain-containing protein n=1 Tax=Azospirillum isscasi TaxID=3053926 RepID=A0ABU0WQ71_9PROT|nr:peptidase G2 autoproteolytic cleavage domain-containing protein [Azospirillum isscasi]MDQ2105709.1 peptidase G2 autoproteolytic cleavage domain-containing protein [Azospirillum isscasi]